MNTSEFQKMIECAVSHDCAIEKKLRCATCELGFKFVAEDPVQLLCGHSICAKCKMIECNNYFECKNHVNTIQTLCGLESIMGKELINSKLQALFKNILYNFEKTVELLEKTADGFENGLLSHVEVLKDNVDLRIESLKIELDKIRNLLRQKLDEHKKNVINQFDEQSVKKAKRDLEELKFYIKSKNELDVSEFYKFQKSLKSSIDSIQKYFSCSFNISYKEPEIEIENRLNELVGKLDFHVYKLRMPKMSHFVYEGFDIEKYRCHHTLTNKGYIFDLKYLGDALLASCNMNEITIWNTKDGKIVRQIESDAFCLFKLKNKRMLISASRYPFRIRAWNMQTFNSIEKGVKGAVSCFEELHNGYLVCAENVDKCNNNILLFNVTEIKIELVNSANEAHSEKICALQCLPDDKLASSSYDRSIKIWRISLEPLRTLLGHSLSVTSLILLPDGHLLSGSTDKSMRVWDYESGACVRLMQDSKGYFEYMSLTNDSKMIACKVGSPCENYSIQFFNDDLKCVSIVPASFIHGNTKLDHFQILDDNCFATVSADTINIFDFEVPESRKKKQSLAETNQPQKKMRFF